MAPMLQINNLAIRKLEKFGQLNKKLHGKFE
jgi:hypothetical protein